MTENEFLRDKVEKKFLNFTYFLYYEYFNNDTLYKVKKYFGGIFTIKDIGSRLKYYFLGIQFYSKKINNFNKYREDVILSSLAVYNLHQKVMPKYKDIYLGRDIVIIATGPTLKKYLPIKNAIHIGVNRAFENKIVALDYLFAVDYSGMTNYIEKAKNHPCKKFYGIYKNPEMPKEWHIPDKVAMDANAERFYSDAGYLRFNINQDISVYPLMDMGSIIFPALHFALWTHPKRIFLVGHDCNNGGYFDNNTKILQKNFGIGKVKYGHTKLKEFLKSYYPDVEVISINPVGIKNYYFDIYTNNGQYVDINSNAFDINNIYGVS